MSLNPLRSKRILFYQTEIFCFYFLLFRSHQVTEDFILYWYILLCWEAGSITHLTSSGSFDDGRLLPAATNGSDVVGRNDWSLYSR